MHANAPDRRVITSQMVKVQMEFERDLQKLGASPFLQHEGLYVPFNDTTRAYTAPALLRDAIDGVDLLVRPDALGGGDITPGMKKAFLKRLPYVLDAKVVGAAAGAAFVVSVDAAQPDAAQRLERLLRPTTWIGSHYRGPEPREIPLKIELQPRPAK